MGNRDVSIFRAKRPEEVFTPRAARVNKAMYVSRPDHERSLKTAVRSGYHVILFGDSGCGKSWLYKQVFEEERIYFCSLDFSSAESVDELDLMILDVISEGELWAPSESKSSTEGGVMPSGIGARITTETFYTRQDSSPFFQLIEWSRKKAGRRTAVIVFENLEHVIGKPDIVKYIRSMLLALDDERFGKYKVQICLVGVPSDIKEILSDGNKFQTISNRVVEVPEVSRMTALEAGFLIRKGFEQELDLDLRNPSFCISHLIYLSDRIPQYLQDLCLHAAFIAEVNHNIIDTEVIDAAATNWIDCNARQSREFVGRILGPGLRKNDQKSRVVYAVSKCARKSFYPEEIETIIRKEFPNTIGDRRLQIRRTLKSLSVGEDRLLKADRSDSKFWIITPKIRSVLRHCVRLDIDDETIRFVNGADYD